MDDFDFSEDEIREQLELLGYKNIPPERLQEFKKDLEQLVRHERSKNSSSSTTTATDGTPPQAGREPTGGHTAGGGGAGAGDNSRPVTYSRPVMSAASDMGGQHSRMPIQIPTAGPLMRERAMSLDSTLDTTGSTERRMMKRKVLRKVDGQSQVFDESSVTESESDDLGSLEERLRQIPVRLGPSRPSTAPEHRARWHTRAEAAKQPAYRLSEDYEGPTALIKPMSVEPHKQNLRKSDPVARFQQYNSSWRSQKAPGERAHKNLRWNVREHMLYHDQVVQKKQAPVTKPNGYQVPTDKKRKALRWQVRNDLAQGLLPPSILD